MPRQHIGNRHRTVRFPLPICPRHGVVTFVSAVENIRTDGEIIKFRRCYCPIHGCPELSQKQKIISEEETLAAALLWSQNYDLDAS